MSFLALDILNIFFPWSCAGCGKVLQDKEKVICTQCLHYLPVIKKQETAENYIKPHFYGRLNITDATSLLFYHKKGISQRLLHHLKYKGREEVSAFLGEWLADRLGAESWLNKMDFIIPVPLHVKRQRKRGYNQVTGFAKALARRYKITYADHILIKTFNSRTQVFKNKVSRSELKTAFFKLTNAQTIRHKHVLLVDDIITTGATLEACAKILKQGQPASISIATMAITI